MSDFLGRVGRITEWVVVSNLENRAVNAACDKAQNWWSHRKDKKHGDHPASDAPPLAHVPSHPMSATSYPHVEPSQATYMAPTSHYSSTSMGCSHLSIVVNHVEGLNQWGPLVVIIECNQQRYQTSLSQAQQRFTFPVYQFDHDQLFIWIQLESQQQTVAHGEIPVRILLNNNNNGTGQQQQQRWIPLRDQYNGPAGQVLVNVDYKTAYPPMQSAAAAAGPSPPPPYSPYS